MNRRNALALALAAALVAWWLWRERGTNRITARPASPSVSFENMLEEADEEQLAAMRRNDEL